jgi:hypothetical protein
MFANEKLTYCLIELKILPMSFSRRASRMSENESSLSLSSSIAFLNPSFHSELIRADMLIAGSVVADSLVCLFVIDKVKVSFLKSSLTKPLL